MINRLRLSSEQSETCLSMNVEVTESDIQVSLCIAFPKGGTDSYKKAETCQRSFLEWFIQARSRRQPADRCCPSSRGSGEPATVGRLYLPRSQRSQGCSCCCREIGCCMNSVLILNIRCCEFQTDCCIQIHSLEDSVPGNIIHKDFAPGVTGNVRYCWSWPPSGL
jgi:hypothetical protein